MIQNVYVDGVFDLFHEGHVNFLAKAASFGKLHVGVHDDAFVQTYKRKPYIPQESRYAVVRACKYVDVLVEGVGVLTDEILDTYNIDIVLHGDDFNLETARKFFKPALERGIFQFVTYTKGVSSTLIAQNIENRLKAQL